MPCIPLRLEGGGTAIVCVRTRHGKPPRCEFCKTEAGRYECDGPAPERKSKTCDALICCARTRAALAALGLTLFVDTRFLCVLNLSPAPESLRRETRETTMQLMTPEVAKLLFGDMETAEVPAEKKICPVKFFDPAGRYTFYAIEYDGGDRLFGYCVSPLGPDCDEWGYASVSEMQAVRNRFGLGIERDLHWRPGPIPPEVLAERGW